MQMLYVIPANLKRILMFLRQRGPQLCQPISSSLLSTGLFQERVQMVIQISTTASVTLELDILLVLRC